MSSPDPEKLGEFEILEKLGHGGMGAVYKARQSSLGRIVALKVLPGNMASDSDFITRFKAEARAAASLNHPGIVQVFAAGEEGGVHYFAMEYVDGESLHHRLQRKGRITPLEALAVCTHVATALHHGWRRAQIIHRDIKPDNIFLSIDGEVKLGDLGLAKSLGEGLHLTQTGASMGTPYYVSPEQAHGESTVDFRADIYSLGCTLFHLVSGQTPYTASSAMAVMVKHITHPPPDIFAAWPECPSALGPLLSRMLAKKPADRHQTYDELIQDLMDAHQAIKTAKPGEQTTRKIPPTDSFPPATPPDEHAAAARVVAKKAFSMAPLWALGGAAVTAGVVLLWAPWTRTHLSPSPPAHSAVSATPGPTPMFPPARSLGSIDPGFTAIFNGYDLTGWDGDPKHWSVSNGAIAGNADVANPVESNTSLIWKGGPVEDFTLRLSFRLTAGNSGVQYRNRVIDTPRWVLGGYQAELYTGMPPLNGALFEERGSRGIMADAGEQARWKAIGTKHLLAKLDGKPAYRPRDWNDLEIVATGDNLVHRINGATTIDVTDEDPARQMRSGLLALRLAKGPEVSVQFKDIRLKKGASPSTSLTNPAAISTPTPTPTPTPVTAPRSTPTPPVVPVPAMSNSVTPAPAVSSSATGFASLTSQLNPGGGIVFQGASGPGLGKHIVFLAGEEEYRSEELLPQLAKILAGYHGFKCTVLFSTHPQTGEIDPNELKHMPGLEALANADLCVMMLRFRAWPDAQMKWFVDYYLAGKPFVALRTSTHAFNGLSSTGPYAAFNYNEPKWTGGFGRQVLGETWASHWGQHKAQATRAIPAEPVNTEPILRGVSTFVGSTDVYEAAPPADARILMRGQVLNGMTDTGGAATGRKKRVTGQEQEINHPMMPVAWTREVRNGVGKTNRIFTCTMGTAAEFQELSFRRFVVNACYWALGFGIPENNNASLVGEFRAHDYGFNGFTKGLKPEDFLLPGSQPPKSTATLPVARKMALYDGSGTSAWQRKDGQPCNWQIVNGALEIGPTDLVTRDKFRDFQLHVEYWLPRYPPTVAGQARGNSGVYLQGRYEVQILDSYGSLPTNATCGAIYRVRASDRNACTEAETWQSFDITFRAARYDAVGRKTTNARTTVVHNGITIHNNVELSTSTYAGAPEGAEPGPILLQSADSRGIRFRNLWITPQ